MNELPPHAPEAERGLLASILMDPDPREGILEALEALQPSGEAFYDLRNRLIFSHLVRRTRENAGIDLVLLQQALHESGDLEKVGGLAYLSALGDASPSAVALPHYVAVVRDKYLQRRLIKTCSDGLALAQARDCEPENLAASLEIDLSNLDGLSQSDAGTSGAGLVEILTTDLERRHGLQGALSGIASPWPDLDKLTEGFQAGEQAIIAARPSMGKTAMGLQIAYQSAFRNKIPTLFFSLEMSKAALLRRLVSIHSSIPLGIVRRGTYSNADFDRFGAFMAVLRTTPLTIVDAVRGLNHERLAGIYRRNVRKHGVRLVIVDYLQKIQPVQRHEKRTYEVGAVSGALKAVAVQTETALVTMAQLNRDPDKDKPRSPRLSDLADSSQIERDADLVALIDRDKSTQEASLIIAKQRDGELGIVHLIFNGRLCKFDSAARTEKGDGI